VSKLSLGVEKAAAARQGMVAVPAILPVPTVRITVPVTEDEMRIALDTLGSGLNAGGWATAATVYAWTEPGTGGPRTGKETYQLSERAFAGLGIRGLSSRPTVRAYRLAWEQAVEAGEVEVSEPGKSVDLPTRDFSFIRLAKPESETPELPAGVFSTIVADPPWEIATGPGWASRASPSPLDDRNKARPLIYPTLSIAAIKALGVKDRTADDAHLYLWTINAYITEAYEIAVAWGFTPSALLTWCKPPHGIGLGGTFVQTTEHVLFARRGSLAAKRRVDTTWFAWPRRAHSVKPGEFFEMVEQVSPGPYLEMFAREERLGWVVWGNEIGADDANTA
jgi:N6-adenosine-specific RNA methylase IME4